MRRIGIMGGTFDPIHNGHLILAQSALTQLSLDQIWFMPAGEPPHKSGSTDKEERLDLLKLAISDNPDFVLFTYEIDKDRTSYSAVTMSELGKLYPDCEFYFIMGADSLFSIDKWYHPEIFCACTNIAAATRNDVDEASFLRQVSYVESRYGTNVSIVNIPRIDISSTHIREMIGKDITAIRYQIPEKVYDRLTGRS